MAGNARTTFVTGSDEFPGTALVKLLVSRGHRVFALTPSVEGAETTGPLVSPIHVHDCVRAPAYLAEHGRTGGRYFIANSAPVRTSEFAKTFARLANRPLRVWRMPAQRPDSWPGRRGPGIHKRTPSFPTSDYARSDLGSSIPLSKTASRKFSEPYMNRTSETTRVPANFDEVILPHLDAAYRLARWLVANEHDAEDIVQDACLRALRYFRTFSGGNSRAWFLRIVRNTCYGWHSHRHLPIDVFDEEQHSGATPTTDPETLTLQAANAALVEHALRELPARFRELLVLRELEGLSYMELADVLGIPMGSVMSGLSRSRQAFRRALETRLKQADRERDEAVV